MRTSLRLLTLAMLSAAAALPGQQIQQPAPRLLRHPHAQVLQTGTKLVVVDVVVQDRAGHPVHGLKRADFTLTEDKHPQTIRNFDEHSRPEPGSVVYPAMPKLPPGTFSDYTPAPPNGTLNILLLDALNTPMKDQSYVRYELQQYVKHADPGTRIAIFGLTNHLILLQGFTAQPEVLKDAVEHKLTPKASDLLDDPVSGDSADESMSDQMSDMGADAQAVSGVAQFEAEGQSFQMQVRMQYTLDAFNQLARYLSTFPGRKNLIWFSGAFPLDILPDDTLADPFSVVTSGEDEYRETSNLLVQSRVAVYPIDARGLMTNPAFDASHSGRGLGSPGAFAAKIASFDESQAEDHMTMEQLANDTGGHAFYNTNGLSQAVTKAIDAGSNFYTLTYTPSNRKADGGYRHIRVTLTGAEEGQGLQLAYRQGYFADEYGSAYNVTSTPSADAARTAANYARAAMDRGAPQPSDILFKVRVLPASAATEAKVAEGNQLNPQKPIKGPFRRYDLDFAVLPTSFSFTHQPNGHYTGAMEYSVLVYDAPGKLMNADGRTAEMDIAPGDYEAFLQRPISMHLEVSAPVKPESFFRIAVHDLPSNRFGVVEVPSASVGKLAPPVYAANSAPGAQAAAAATPAAATGTPAR